MRNLFERIFQEREGRRQADGSFMCLCPAHDDHDPSLHVSLINNKILVHCKVGCSQKDIVTALRTLNLWPTSDTNSKVKPHTRKPQPQTSIKKASAITPQGIFKTRNEKTLSETWAYKDEAGKVMGHVARYDGQGKKEIIPYFNYKNGQWSPGAPKAPRPLYALNYIAGAPQDLTIWIVEGEKCVEALQSLPRGVRRLTTTSMGGTNAARFTDWSPLAGRKIKIWPDHDEPGKKYTDEVKFQLEGLMPPPTIEIVDTAKLGLKEKEDVFDWLQTHDSGELNNIPLVAPVENMVEVDFKIPETPKIEMHKIHGFAAKFVKLATVDSEADPAAVLSTFLVRFGVEIGRDLYFYVSDTKHRGQLAAVVVGNSALSRKGTSAKPVQKLFDYENIYGSDTLEFRPARHSNGPFSSGEGIIYAVRDPIIKWETKGKDQGKKVIEDPGEKDKRLFILDEEFAGVLANTKREGNTLSSIIRLLWDGRTLEPLTKNKKIKATGAHVGWVSHITNQELNEKMPKCEAFNGFANRILWIFASRRGSIPNPGPMNEDKLRAIKDELLDILHFCRDPELKKEITLSPGALATWENLYSTKLAKVEPGLLGILTARGSAQVRRLAMLFALLDKETVISTNHLNQAMAVWEYSLESARYIFDETGLNSNQAKLCDALQKKQEMTNTEIRNLFDRNLSTDKLKKLLAGLVDIKRIKIEKRKTEKSKKPVTFVSLIETCI